MTKQTRLLTAYRFSSAELEKMNWLKSVFEKNEYSFKPNRFPEVYYVDFKEVEDLFPEKQREEIVDPDALGYYFDFFKQVLSSKEEEYWSKSEEGKIILFKDRIEAFCVRNLSLSEEGVRFVVLMHELGHWMSHWAENSGRWIYGFQFPNRFTKEALAQLIAYWCCNGDPLHEQVLLALSPKDSLGKVDASRIYGAYETLKRHSPVDLLKKLAQLRVFWMVKDEKMLQFLNSDFLDLALWMKKIGKGESETLQDEFVEKSNLEFLWKKINNRSADVAHKVYETLEIGDPQWEPIGVKGNTPRFK